MSFTEFLHEHHAKLGRITWAHQHKVARFLDNNDAPGIYVVRLPREGSKSYLSHLYALYEAKQTYPLMRPCLHASTMLVTSSRAIASQSKKFILHSATPHGIEVHGGIIVLPVREPTTGGVVHTLILDDVQVVEDIDHPDRLRRALRELLMTVSPDDPRVVIFYTPPSTGPDLVEETLTLLKLPVTILDIPILDIPLVKS